MQYRSIPAIITEVLFCVAVAVLPAKGAPEGSILFNNRGANGSLIIHDCATGIDTHLGEGFSHGRGAFSPDGRQVAIRRGNGQIRLINVTGDGYRDLLAESGGPRTLVGGWLTWTPSGHIYWVGGEGPQWNDWTGPARSVYRVSALTGVVEKVYDAPDTMHESTTITRDGTTAYFHRRWDLTGVKPVTIFFGTCGASISGSGKVITSTNGAHDAVIFWDGEIFENCCPSNQTTGVCYGGGCGPDNYGCGGTCETQAYIDEISLPPVVWVPRFATPPHAGDRWFVVKKGFNGEQGSYLVDRDTRQYWHFGAEKGDPCDFWPGPLPSLSSNPDLTLDNSVTIPSPPRPDTVRVLNSGGGTLGAIAVGGRAPWLTVETGGGGNAQFIVLSVQTADLQKGIYTDTLHVTADGLAADTAWLRVILSVGGALAPPSELVATSAGPGTPAVVSWKDNSANETGFSIERTGPSNTLFTVIGSAGANGVSFRDSGLVNSGDYRYRIRAVSSTDSSDYSSETILRYLSGRVIEILSPGPGAQWVEGQQATIGWTAEESVASAAIGFSIDNGDSWQMLYNGSISRDNPIWGNYTFTVPAPAGSMILITVYNYNSPGDGSAEAGPVQVVEFSSVGPHDLTVDRQSYRTIGRDSRCTLVLQGKSRLRFDGCFDLRGKRISGLNDINGEYGRLRTADGRDRTAAGVLLINSVQKSESK